ncbi:hypothetical protein A0O34_18010 [Chryseobacterium glaciei]|uniref:Secretion system C-terminal sorting domain-containing protein n=1 Tax=Chryseobacterium glaciei TaxID=1685010 RepID=A0A172XZ62_9FLAO|nr:T9SS type A sorting domain-containing protein [Chryseobacterium glaciei]ANF52298.1 hypothetical protein A0O34_18010 [Chryseobacterium glaciei]
MKRDLLNMKSLAVAVLLFSTGFVNGQWLTTGNATTSSLNYVGTTGIVPLFLRVNGATTNPGQASLTSSGSFVVDGVNNSNTVNAKGSLVAGIGNVLGANVDSSLIVGWENNLSNSGGGNIVAGQLNTVLNSAGKSVALGWANTIRATNQFAIGVGIDLGTYYSGGFGIDLATTGDRSFVIGSGTSGAKLTNTIPRSIMFGMSGTSTMLIRDQFVGVRTTAPTANFHSVGTVRLQGLPSGSGRALVVDNDGNVMVATSTITRQSDNQNPVEIQTQIDELKKEIQELKDLLKQNKISLDLSSESNGPRLYQNIPNPAKGETDIKYYLPANSKQAAISVYSISGQLVKTISLKDKGNGTINITGIQSGSYVYQMTVDGKVAESKKMLIQ